MPWAGGMTPHPLSGLVVAVVGTPVGYAAAHDAFRHAWWALSAVAVLAALFAPAMTPRTVAAAPVAAPAPATV